ncbi:MAG TPA: hypothetical protein VG899_12845 [Mycobacteriales bacterium]|nr:hypothetical protein [Mycobacteriales bacterium]
MTDLAMHEQTYLPNGSHPLRVMNRTKRNLMPAVADVDTRCYLADFAAMHNDPPPAGCLRVIKAGSHYLRHRVDGIAWQLDGRTFDYCAPCACRELACYGVVEVPR